MPLEEMVQRVFLTKPDERGNTKQARIIELINKFNDDLEVNPIRCQFKIAFEDNESGFEDIMSYNDILEYVEREYNNEDRHLWKFRKIISHSLISGKRGVKDKIEVQMMWETGAISTEYFKTLYRDIPVDLTIYAKKWSTGRRWMEETG